MGTLTVLPCQDVLVPGQVVELVSCLELPPEKDHVPSQLQESPRSGSWWQKLLKKLGSYLPDGLGARLWLVRAEARCQLLVSQARASQLGLSGEEPGLAVLSFLWRRQPGAAQEAKENAVTHSLPDPITASLVLGAFEQRLAWFCECFWFLFQGRPGGSSGVLQRGLRAKELRPAGQY